MKSNLAVISQAQKTDSEIKEYILSELKYEPSVKATDVGVLVNNGIVTLNGFVSSYSERGDALRAAKRILGVKAIANDIKVKLPGSYQHSDSDIAAAAVSQLKCAPTVPKDSVQITVSDGWITLEGVVEWGYQKNVAENVVKYLVGVKGVSNDIEIKPKLTVSGIEKIITDAFERSALLDSKKVDVKISGSKVILTGEVRNHTERDEAERVVWAAPGVSSVDNEITVAWSCVVL